MLTQDDAEKAVDWLLKNARKMAKARAERLYMEQWIKTVKATLQVEASETSVSRSEMIALASHKYMVALQAYKEAVEADEYNRFGVAAAEATIEAWRTQESTRRAENKATS